MLDYISANVQIFASNKDLKYSLLHLNLEALDFSKQISSMFLFCSGMPQNIQEHLSQAGAVWCTCSSMTVYRKREAKHLERPLVASRKHFKYQYCS